MEEIAHHFGTRWAIVRDGDAYVVKLYGNEVCRCASVEDALDEIALSEGDKVVRRHIREYEASVA